jgi:hypothetical protein
MKLGSHGLLACLVENAIVSTTPNTPNIVDAKL